MRTQGCGSVRASARKGHRFAAVLVRLATACAAVTAGNARGWQLLDEWIPIADRSGNYHRDFNPAPPTAAHVHGLLGSYFKVDWYWYNPETRAWVKRNHSHVYVKYDGQLHEATHTTRVISGSDLLYTFTWTIWHVHDGEMLHVLNGMEEDDPLNPGCPQALTVDPINTISGRAIHDEVDLHLPAPGLGLDLTFRRVYINNTRYLNGPLGPNWVHSFDWRLTTTNAIATRYGVLDLPCVFVRDGAGARHALFRSPTNEMLHSVSRPAGVTAGATFASSPPETAEAPRDEEVWSARHGSKWRLTAVGPDAYRLTEDGVSFRVFNAEGLLQSVADGAGNEIVLSYTNTATGARPARIRHSNGLYLDLEYDGARLVEVRTPSPDLYVQFSYNPQGELTNTARVVSGRRLCTSYVYDTDGNHSLVERVDAAGRARTFRYDIHGKRCTELSLAEGFYRHRVVHQPSSRSASVFYDRKGDDEVYDYHYDSRTHRVKSILSRNFPGERRDFEYDWQNRELIRERLRNVDTGFSRTATYAYDEHRNVTQAGLAFGDGPERVWRYAWDPACRRPLSVVDPGGFRTEYEYTNGLPVRVQRHTGEEHPLTTTYAFDDNGQLAERVDPTGHAVRFAYDAYGRLSAVYPDAGPSVVFSNNLFGFVTHAVRPGPEGPRVTRFFPDPLGRVTRIDSADGRTWRFHHCPLGRVTNAVDALGREFSYVYSPAGKLLSASRPLLGESHATLTVSCGYDPQCDMLSITNEMGRAVESYALDAKGRAVRIENIEGQHMTLAYRPDGQASAVTRFDGTAVTHVYDEYGRLAGTQCGGHARAWTYTLADLLSTASNEHGGVVHEMDGANRLARTEQPFDNSSVSYAYFPGGQLAGLAAAGGETRYACDGAGRVTRIEPPGGLFVYTYDAYSGYVSTNLYAVPGVSMRCTYDRTDRLASIGWHDRTNGVLRFFGYTYDAADRVVSVEREDGSRREYAYDSLDRLIRERRLDPQGNCLAERAYAYDPAGNRLEHLRGGLLSRSRFVYGAQGNRLESWDAAAGADWALAELECDAGLHVWAEVVRGGAEIDEAPPRGTFFRFGGPLPALEQPASVRLSPALPGLDGVCQALPEGVQAHIVSNIVYRYTDAGCLAAVVVQREDGVRERQFEWNAWYELVAVSDEGQAVERYGYDALGRRFLTVSGGQTSRFVYAGMQILEELDGENRLQKRYTHGPGIDNVLSMSVFDESGQRTYHYLKDHQGSVLAVIDENGAIVEQYEYDAWGRVDAFDGDGQRIFQSRIGNRFLWHGREYAWKTGLYYFRARWYDPLTGRWLSKDPIGISGGLNQYVAFGNNPVNFRDPLGLWTVEIGGGLGIAGKMALGHNSGRWTLNISGGLGAGLMGSLDLDDRGPHHVSDGFAFGLQVLAEANATVGPVLSLGGAARLYAEADVCDNSEGGWELIGNTHALRRTQTYGLRGVLRSHAREATVDPVIEPFRSDSVGGGGFVFGGVGARLSW